MMNVVNINGNFINLSEVAEITQLQFYDDPKLPKGLGSHGGKFSIILKSGYVNEFNIDFKFVFGMAPKIFARHIRLDDSYMVHFIKKILHLSNVNFARHDYFGNYWNTSEDFRKVYATPRSLNRIWECSDETISQSFKISMRDVIKTHYNELVTQWRRDKRNDTVISFNF